MRIAIITDAWEPQVNGVVNTLKATRECLRQAGHDVMIISPEGLRTFACPTYPEIRLACKPYRKIEAALADFRPDCIHIATEGPMGLAARRFCLKHRLEFTTAYHTRFPEYMSARSMLPAAIVYRWLRWFHGPSRAVLVPTPRIRESLVRRGFHNVVLWSRGVDTESFKPLDQDGSCIVRPLYLYVGRVSVEKNVEAFLALDLPGTKWVIGDGPLREAFEKKYPAIAFLGPKANADLVRYYNCADVFVFPSLTDTFGLVLVEAMACGVPVAAFPVDGPIDVVAQGRSGVLDDDLKRACTAALNLDRSVVRAHAMTYSWAAATQQFLAHLHPVQAVGCAAPKNVGATYADHAR